jgi:hypothetical protein
VADRSAVWVVSGAPAGAVTDQLAVSEEPAPRPGAVVAVVGVTFQPDGADRLSATPLTAPDPLLASVALTVEVAPGMVMMLDDGLIVSWVAAGSVTWAAVPLTTRLIVRGAGPPSEPM